MQKKLFSSRSIFPDEEGTEGPAGREPALEELHRQRADEHHGEAPRAAGDQKQKVKRIRTHMPNDASGRNCVVCTKNICLSVISRTGTTSLPLSEHLLITWYADQRWSVCWSQMIISLIRNDQQTADQMIRWSSVLLHSVRDDHHWSPIDSFQMPPNCDSSIVAHHDQNLCGDIHFDQHLATSNAIMSWSQFPIHMWCMTNQSIFPHQCGRENVCSRKCFVIFNNATL